MRVLLSSIGITNPYNIVVVAFSFFATLLYASLKFLYVSLVVPTNISVVAV